MLFRSPLRRTLGDLARDPERAARLRLPLGGFVGLGGFVYAFLCLGGWLDEPSLVSEAHDLTLLFTPERLAAAAEPDVVDGCAGAVLALLALDVAAPGTNAAGATPLDVAVACAGHLLDRLRSHQGRPRAWPGAAAPPLGGFAHGSTGIGYALFRLYKRTGDPALRDTALEGFAFDRSLFDAGADNWLDPRTGRLLEQSAWCHGAPGILLGRLGALDIHQPDGAELDRLVRLTRAVPFRPLDHLCCGNLGRAEILLFAHQALGGGELLDDVRSLAERTMARAETEGGFALCRPGETPGLRPAFFHGLSGIGYALLRLTGARPLPCILCLESSTCPLPIRC